MFGFLKKSRENPTGLQLESFVGLQDPVMNIASREVVFCTENDRIIDVLASMLGGIRRMPVLDDRGELKGVVSATDVLDFVGGGEKNRLFTNTGLSAVVRKIMSTDLHCLALNDSIPVAMEIFKSNGRPMLPITDSGKVSAVVSESDMTHIVNRHCGVPVSRIMSRKPISAAEDHSVFDVAKMLCRGPYRRLPIVNNGVVMGIVTPYDILSHLNRSESLNTLRFEHGPIKAVMNRSPVTVTEDADVSEAVAMMKVKKISGMPVVSEDADVVGMVTKRDIINAFK